MQDAPYSNDDEIVTIIEGPLSEFIEAEKILELRKQWQDERQKMNSENDAHFMNFDEIKAAGLLGGSGLPLGFFPDNGCEHPLHYVGERHLITIAPNGSGKGSCVQITALLEYDGSVFMIDPKGENAAVAARFRRDVLGQKVYVLNPFDILKPHFDKVGFASARFNPLASLDPASKNFVADVSALCEALILTQGKDPYFDDTARNLIACLVMHVCTDEDETRTLPRVRELLSLPQETPDDEKNLLKGKISSLNALFSVMAASDFKPMAQKAAAFLKDTKGNDAVISTARTQTNFLDDPALIENLSDSDFRFSDLKREGVTVFVMLPAKMLYTYSRWFRLLVTSAIDEMTASETKGVKPVLFMLDEAPILGHLSCIETAIGLARGYGVQLWTFWQDLNQLKRIYEEGAHSFFANSGIHQFFTPNDLETAEFISNCCGEKTTFATSTSYGNSLSSTDSERKEPLYSAHALRGMPQDQQILFVAGNSNPVKAGKVPYFKNDGYLGQYDRNPYI